MVTAEQIRQQISAYVLGDLSLDEFEDWLVAATWNAPAYTDSDTCKLVFAIEAKLAEYSSGHIDQNSLRSQFADYCRHYRVDWTHGSNGAGLYVQTGSSNVLMGPVDWKIRSVDIEPEVVCA